MEGFIFFIFIIILIASLIYSFHHSKQVDAAWAQAAGMLRMAFDPGGIGRSRKIAGKCEDHVVTIDTFTRRHGKSSTTYTRYAVMHRRPLRMGLSLRKESFFSGVTKAFGAQDILTGDPAFDSLMLIKGSDPDAVLKFLTPERRNRIQQAMRQFDDLEINDTGVTLEIRGAVSASQTIVDTVLRLVHLIEGMADTPQPVSTPAPMQAAPVTLLIPAVATAQPEPEPEPAIILDASDVAMVLFGSSASVAEIEQAFAANFAGKTTEGRGLLRQWQASGYDFDFGTGPCVRATVDVPLAERDSYGRNHTEVMVCLPADAKPTAIGGDFTFTGNFLKVDALMRRLFIRADT